MRSNRLIKELPLHLMVWPALIIILIYAYAPMAGIIIAFEKFIPVKGMLNSEWIGLTNFKFLLELPDFKQVIFNTLNISIWKVATGLIVPIIVALLLNEVRKIYFQRVIQTLIYLPYFLSWVLLAGILIDVLSPNYGIVNSLIKLLGFQPIFFLGDNSWFQPTVIITNVWKEFGFNTIIYLAALTSIDPTYYESAIIDGASRWKQTLHITLPCMKPIIVLMMTLSLGSLFNAGFDQIFNLYNPVVYQSGDILDTMIYRMGLLEARYGLSTAVSVFRSFISFILISVSYFLAYKFADYRIF